MSCEVGTIRQVHRRLINEGFLISEHTLRQWIKSGRLPAVFVGKKALISFSNVTTILTASSPPTSTEPQPPDPGLSA